jgi:hypothetical protein
LNTGIAFGDGGAAGDGRMGNRKSTKCANFNGKYPFPTGPAR